METNKSTSGNPPGRVQDRSVPTHVAVAYHYAKKSAKNCAKGVRRQAARRKQKTPETQPAQEAKEGVRLTEEAQVQMLEEEMQCGYSRLFSRVRPVVRHSCKTHMNFVSQHELCFPGFFRSLGLCETEHQLFNLSSSQLTSTWHGIIQ